MLYLYRMFHSRSTVLLDVSMVLAIASFATKGPVVCCAPVEFCLGTVSVNSTIQYSLILNYKIFDFFYIVFIVYLDIMHMKNYVYRKRVQMKKGKQGPIRSNACR